MEMKIMIEPIKAKLKDNKIYCPNCDAHNYKLLGNYKGVIKEGKRLTEFNGKCKECGQEFYFFSNLTTEEHFVFNEDEAKEVEETE
jgi:Zn finger protein HypA/HybF involved in hydrogenase expression